MKKHILMGVNLSICLVMIVGFLGVYLCGCNTFGKILEDDIENISRLTSSTIYSEINGELTKPIFVAQTMANDTFLKTWLRQEPSMREDDGHLQELQNYLYALKEKYQYDSVFAISAATQVYYHYEGINKVISPEDEHDDWYYGFLERGASYELEIDTDEANQNQLTVFVDCRIEDEDGSLMGVVGVGVKMVHIQQLLAQYEREYQLQAFLINPDGLVQAHTDSGKIGTVNLFSIPGLRPFQEEILGNLDSMEMHWYPEGQTDSCLITRYIQNMNWYLIVEKNTRAIRDSFQSMLVQDALISLAILGILLTMSTVVIQNYNRRMLQLSNRDGLTGLPNQRAFGELFQKGKGQSVGKTGKTGSPGILFIFDVDHFKRINDTKGHLAGNHILYQVARAAEDAVAGQGVVARWGGDEFAGVLYVAGEEAKPILDGLLKRVRAISAQGTVTVSVGTTEIQNGEDLNRLLGQADQALYVSKRSGRNRITRYEDLEQAE